MTLFWRTLPDTIQRSTCTGYYWITHHATYWFASAATPTRVRRALPLPPRVDSPAFTTSVLPSATTAFCYKNVDAYAYCLRIHAIPSNGLDFGSTVVFIHLVLHGWTRRFTFSAISHYTAFHTAQQAVTPLRVARLNSPSTQRAPRTGYYAAFCTWNMADHTAQFFTLQPDYIPFPLALRPGKNYFTHYTYTCTLARTFPVVCSVYVRWLVRF